MGGQRCRVAGCPSAVRTAVMWKVVVVWWFVCATFPLRGEQPPTPISPQSATSDSGDPLELQADEIRDLWRMLTCIQRRGAKPAELSKSASEIAEVRYLNGLDAYMTLRHAEIAAELGVRAWVIDFVGGPFHCWLEVNETGQNTFPTREPFGGEPGLKDVFWECEVEQGRLLFWFFPGAADNNPSPRSRKILERVEAFQGSAQSIPELIGLQVVGGQQLDFQLKGEPRVPALWSSWHGVSIRENSKAALAEIMGEVVLLAVTASEVAAAAGGPPRTVSLTLKAKPLSQ